MEKLALAMMYAQSLPPQPFKNGLQMPHMFIWCLAKINQVINATLSKGQARKNLFHHSIRLDICIF